MQLAGHLGVALLVLVPLRFVFGRDDELEFALLGLAFSMLPDLDLVVPDAAHHGVFHTVTFVALASLVAGASSVGLLWRFWTRINRAADEFVAPRELFAFCAAAAFVGGCSHLVADLLSAPDIAPPIRPFWPLWDGAVVVDVAYYASPTWNYGLLLAGALAHVAVTAVSGRPRWRTVAYLAGRR